VRTSHTLTVDEAGLATLCSPRDDTVAERALPGGHRFEAVEGPFTYYRREVEIGPDGGDGRRVVKEAYDFTLAPGAWPFLIGRLMKRGLRRTALSRHQLWWAPTERLDPRAATVLGLLAGLSVVLGYLTFLLAQTMTFAAEEFEVGTTGQGVALSAVRIGAVLSVVFTMFADRRGRRQVLVASILCAVGATAAGALVPHIVGLAGTQAVARGSATAAGALIVVVVAEEMPSGARAWALAQVTMAGGAGAGGALILLPLVELGTQGWRLLYAAPLLTLPLVHMMMRRLPETQRFRQPHREVTLESHLARLGLIMVMLFLLNVFISPASQFRNEFLKDERGFDGFTLPLFTALSGGLAAIGVVIGGRLAESYGRRIVGGVAALGMAVFLTLSFVVGGPAMWVTATAGMVAMAALAPATTIFGAELFPTATRGRANGIAAAVAMGGSVVGLLTAGVLADRFGTFGPAIAVVAAAPLVAALLIALRFPETAHKELEELNPEDREEPEAQPDPAPAPAVEMLHRARRTDR
jgi:MFS family permease